MARPPSSNRCPILHLLAVWKADEGLQGPVRQHLIATVREAWRESVGDGVMRRVCVAETLMLYRDVITTEPGLLARARGLSETVRSLRSLGLLHLSEASRRAAPASRRRGQAGGFNFELQPGVRAPRRAVEVDDLAAEDDSPEPNELPEEEPDATNSA